MTEKTSGLWKGLKDAAEECSRRCWNQLWTHPQAIPPDSRRKLALYRDNLLDEWKRSIGAVLLDRFAPDAVEQTFQAMREYAKETVKESRMAIDPESQTSPKIFSELDETYRILLSLSAFEHPKHSIAGLRRSKSPGFRRLAETILEVRNLLSKATPIGQIPDAPQAQIPVPEGEEETKEPENLEYVEPEKREGQL